MRLEDYEAAMYRNPLPLLRSIPQDRLRVFGYVTHWHPGVVFKLIAHRVQLEGSVLLPIQHSLNLRDMFESRQTRIKQFSVESGNCMVTDSHIALFKIYEGVQSFNFSFMINRPGFVPTCLKRNSDMLRSLTWHIAGPVTQAAADPAIGNYFKNRILHAHPESSITVLRNLATLKLNAISLER